MSLELSTGLVSTAIDPPSDTFAAAFPHLVPGVLRRRLTESQIVERASSEMHSLARSVAWSFANDDPALVEAMVERFTDVVFVGKALRRFDPGCGKIGAFLRGVMRNVFRECIRERLRRKLEKRLDETQIDHWRAGPAAAAEVKDELQRVRGWVAELPDAQRDAVARRFGLLGDLDRGGDFHEQAALHRGMNALRKRAAEAALS